MFSPYSVRIQQNTDQKTVCIWALFTQCHLKFFIFFHAIILCIVIRNGKTFPFLMTKHFKPIFMILIMEIEIIVIISFPITPGAKQSQLNMKLHERKFLGRCVFLFDFINKTSHQSRFIRPMMDEFFSLKIRHRLNIIKEPKLVNSYQEVTKLLISYQLRESYHGISQYYHRRYEEDLSRYVLTTSRKYHEKTGENVQKSWK